MGIFYKRNTSQRAVSLKSPILHQIHHSTFLPKSKPEFSAAGKTFAIPLPGRDEA